MPKSAKIPTNSYLNVPNEVVEHMQKRHGMNPALIQGKINMLKMWIDQQPHFPKITNDDDDLLERFLVRSNFDLDVVKDVVENYLTVRKVYRKFFSASNEHIEPYNEAFTTLPLPKLTENNERIIFFRMSNPILEAYSLDRVVFNVGLTLEFLARHDYVDSMFVVMDCAQFSIDHLRLATLSQLAAFSDLLIRGYSYKCTGIVYLNTPVHWNVIMDIWAKIFDPIALQNVKCLNGINGLYDTVLKPNCFPKDYGGELPSVDQLLKQWDKVFKENMHMFNASYYLVSDESKRIPNAQTDEENFQIFTQTGKL